jgi:hypothetical protein
MRLRPLIWAGILAAVTFSLGRALVTHDGVGPLEYLVGIALVVLLAGAAFRAGRRAVSG